MMQALAAGHAGCVTYLLKRRANPAAANKQGKTALDVAKSEEVKGILSAALEAPAEAEETPSEQPPEAEAGKAAHAAHSRKRPAESEAEAEAAPAQAGSAQAEQTFNPAKRMAGAGLQDDQA